MEVMEKLERCVQSVRSRISFVPLAALILGSGLGDFAETVDIKASLPYSDIEGFPTSTVAGHKGRFIFCDIGGVPTVVMQGRVHYYEGYSMSDVVLPVRLMACLGAKLLFLTNASGGVNTSFTAGDLMLIQDQISFFVPSPLNGANSDKLGVRFPDMTEIYDKQIRTILEIVATGNNIPLKKGIYMQLAGPQFESPAEIRAARTLGADAVGMSTACEAIAARHMGMQICGVSCITNLAAGMSGALLSAEEVDETAGRVAGQFQKLVRESIPKIAMHLIQ